MSVRQAACILFLVLFSAGCSVDRHALYQSLPEEDKELFARSRQFMTDRQQETFLLCPDSPCREELIEGLHIQDRLARFAPHVRDAIMAQRVVPGMNMEALLLSWGRPEEIIRRDVDGVPTACWYYRRGGEDGKIALQRVFVISGMVTEVVSGP